MLISHRWSKRTALLMVLGITSTALFPLLHATPATASSEPYVVGQLFGQSERATIPAGTVIPVQYDDAERIVVTPNETTDVTLIVAANIRSSSGRLLIPSGSRIEGKLEPAGNGTQFVADTLIIRNREIPIDATSSIISRRETIERGTEASQILKGAAIGAAAAAVISEVFGDIDLEEVLAGGGIGAIAGLLLGGGKQVEVIVVQPETDLDLTLQSDLAVY